MIPLLTKKWPFVCTVLLLSVLFFAIVNCITRKADCTPYCSPVIAVTNYQQFSELLKNITKNFMIAQLKANLSQKLSFSYKPGNFISSADESLAGTTNFPYLISGIVNQGLKAQTNFVSAEMNAANFTNTINNAALTVLNNELKRHGIAQKEIAAVLTNYQRVLNSESIVGTYSSQVSEYQTMVSQFLPVSSNLMTQMTGLSGKMDVASSMRFPEKDMTVNTRETLDECMAHTRDGLKILGNIANLTVGDSVNSNFTAANGSYLKVRLGKIGSGIGKGALTDEEIERIIITVNSAAVQTVPQYITRSVNSLISISSVTMAEVNAAMKQKVQSALNAINNAAIAEKAKETITKSLYLATEKDVMGLISDARNYERYARQKNTGSIFDNNNMKEIMVLSAKRESSANLKRLAIKHYITARTSLEVAANIKTQLSKFDPATIDKGYEDQAWKDIARFQYYLVHLENQQLKLLAIRAMAQAADIDDPNVLSYIETSGPPAD